MDMDGTLRVLIADDHPLILRALRRALEGDPEIAIVGEATSSDAALALAERRSPHVVLLDLRMPGIGGLECAAEIKRRRPETKIVVLSACDDQPTIDAAFAAGASAYMLKSVAPTDIASVVRGAASGAVFHAPAVPSHAESSEPDADSEPALTRRETAVLEAIATGLTTSAISRELWLSEHTVKFHLTNIYRKLGVSNRSAAVRYAHEHNLARRPLATARPRPLAGVSA
jgi:DNA-binding NarL/FixJ family response regulator